MAGTLSGGEQQMLAIARGLMSERSIAAGRAQLGSRPSSSTRCFEIIKRINVSGITSCRRAERLQAMTVSDYTYVLENGRIVKHGRRRSFGRRGRAQGLPGRRRGRGRAGGDRLRKGVNEMG